MFNPSFGIFSVLVNIQTEEAAAAVEASRVGFHIEIICYCVQRYHHTNVVQTVRRHWHIKKKIHVKHDVLSAAANHENGGGSFALIMNSNSQMQ